MASKFNDEGVNQLFALLLKKIEDKTGKKFGEIHFEVTAKVSQAVIPPSRSRYLSEISDNNRNYDQLVKDQSALLQNFIN
jgi:methylmalonyl-CoA mutase